MTHFEKIFLKYLNSLQTILANFLVKKTNGSVSVEFIL